MNVRVDPHAHLYDSYSSKVWCESALRNLSGRGDALAVVIIVDREGQDSLARLRNEVPAFAAWRDIWNGEAGEVRLSQGVVTLVRGVQYVSRERIEVLGLFVGRASPDGLPVSEYITLINEDDGIPCLPWSPGKWLGERGRVVTTILDEHSPSEVTVGDIAIRSRVGPPSLLLRYAKRRGFTVLCGTDPLPRAQDQSLVGSFGVEVTLSNASSEDPISADALKEALRSGHEMREWGERNSAIRAATRFASTL